MARLAEQVLKEALQLPEDERAELVCDLIDSFGAPKSLERTDEEWIAEIERRARAAIAGEPGIPWGKVRAAVKRRLGDVSWG
jgi:putative addiction module component (TIGR02574 family)